MQPAHFVGRGTPRKVIVLVVVALGILLGGCASSGADDATSEGALAGDSPNADSTRGGSCKTARDIGTMTGDARSSLGATGTCSEWLRVRVTEENRLPTGWPMSLTAKLVSSRPQDLELRAYLDATCERAAVSSSLVGTDDVLQLRWGEQGVSNGTDDDRTVTFEVRATGACSNTTWSLQLTGDTPVSTK